MANAFKKVEWATDTNYAAGADPWSGTATKVEPTSQTKTKGYVPEQPASAQQTNWALATLADTVNALGAIPALNIGPPVTAALAQLTKYNRYTREWIGISSNGNDKLVRTKNVFSWPTFTEITPTNGIPTYDFDTDPATGNILVVGDTLDKQWFYTESTNIWSLISGTIGNDPVRPALVWEPSAARWVYGSLRSGAANNDFAWSADGVTFTAVTKPAGWVAGTDVDVTLGSGDGKVVARAVNGSNLYTSVSTDGGSTWSATVTTALGFTQYFGGPGIRKSSPVWTGVKWIISTSDIDSTPRTKLWTSVDGATWSVLADLTDVGITKVAFLTPALGLGVDGSTGELVYTTDGGTTWAWAGTDVGAGSTTEVSASPVAFLLADVGNGQVHPGLAVGPGLGAVG